MKAKIIHITELKRCDIFVTIAGRPTRVHEKHVSGGQVMSWPDPDKFPDFAPGEMVARIDPEPVKEREFWRVKTESGYQHPHENEWEAMVHARELACDEFSVVIEHVRETVLSREEVKP